MFDQVLSEFKKRNKRVFHAAEDGRCEEPKDDNYQPKSQRSKDSHNNENLSGVWGAARQPHWVGNSNSFPLTMELK